MPGTEACCSELKLFGALIVAESLDPLGVIINSSTLKSHSCAISPFWWLATSMGCAFEYPIWCSPAPVPAPAPAPVVELFEPTPMPNGASTSSGRTSSIASRAPALPAPPSPNISNILPPASVIDALESACHWRSGGAIIGIKILVFGQVRVPKITVDGNRY